MNTRMGELAADVAFATPAAIPVALIFGYNGAALKSRAQVDAWGRPFVMGFESSTTRSYAGGDAGEADSAFSCGVFDSWGYPRECGSWVCAADDPNTPAQFLANCEEYGYRYALRQMVGGRFGPIAVYGNPAAVEAVCRGIRRAGLVALRWGVGTWGYGEGGGANRPPGQADVDVLQSGNSPGPVPDTDLDWLYVPVATFAALGGPTPEDDMAQADIDALRESADKVNAALFGDFPFGTNKGLIQEFHELKAFVDGGNVAYGRPTLVGEIAEKVSNPTIDVAELAAAIAAKLPAGTAIDPAVLAAEVASHLELVSR